MNMNLRTLTSAIVGLGLAVFTVYSAVRFDFAGDSTVVGFALLTVYALIEIAILSYLPPRSIRARSGAARATADALHSSPHAGPMPVWRTNRRAIRRAGRTPEMVA